MAAKKKPKAVRKAVPKLEREEIRDHGEVVTAPSGTSQEAVIDSLTGADQLPPIGQELGREPSAPPFDPHVGHEMTPGREFGDEADPLVTTLVFMGIDRGGDFEDRIQQLVKIAEDMGLRYITATIGSLDLYKLVDEAREMMNELPDDDEDDEDEEKPEPYVGEPF